VIFALDLTWAPWDIPQSLRSMSTSEENLSEPPLFLTSARKVRARACPWISRFPRSSAFPALVRWPPVTVKAEGSFIRYNLHVACTYQ
jgi:hypothetical protein